MLAAATLPVGGERSRHHRKRIVGGPALFETEPHAPDALTAFPNVVLTPHVGGHTLESHRAMQDCAIANLAAYFAGKPLPHVVR